MWFNVISKSVPERHATYTFDHPDGRCVASAPRATATPRPPGTRPVALPKSPAAFTTLLRIKPINTAEDTAKNSDKTQKSGVALLKHWVGMPLKLFF